MGHEIAFLRALLEALQTLMYDRLPACRWADQAPLPRNSVGGRPPFRNSQSAIRNSSGFQPVSGRLRMTSITDKISIASLNHQICGLNSRI
jgi:hypothetical protein